MDAGNVTGLGNAHVANEIFDVLKHLQESGRQPEYAAANKPVLRCREAEPAAGGPCVVTTLSPADRQLTLFWSEIAAMMPAVRQLKRRATPQGPNNIAVAVWVLSYPLIF
jgi:hypothetical protein